MTSLFMNGQSEQTDDSKMVSGYNLTKMDTIALKEKSENLQTELKNALTGVINSEKKKHDKEITFLKELIVSHLDIIQQQAEQLSIKDRLINNLKNEKETLSMRLVRMERRVNLDRTRSTDSDKPDDINTSLRLQPTTSRVRRMSTDVISTGSKVSSGDKLTLSTSSSPIPPRDSKKQKRHRHITEETSCGDADESLRKTPNLGSSNAISNKLTTMNLYYTSVGEGECRWAPDLTSEQTTSTNKHSLLEVPSWRIRSYSSSYTMEGTENLQDDVFERRHTSLYKDEKRRKRWDVQRIREMRHNERLRQRQVGLASSKSHHSHMTESLWPRPTRDTNLIVHQTVPIAAFGITLHTLQQRDFLFSSFTFPSGKTLKGFKRAKR